MTDQPGRRTGQQGRDELEALTDEELKARAEAAGVTVTEDDGSARPRQAIIANLANKERQAERGQPAGGKTAEPETPAEPVEPAES